jgi:hypothetical protein
MSAKKIPNWVFLVSIFLFAIALAGVVIYLMILRGPATTY